LTNQGRQYTRRKKWRPPNQVSPVLVRNRHGQS